ncbi:MAG: VWA domain-containing protein [Gammaproteobacteria bacterium]
MTRLLASAVCAAAAATVLSARQPQNGALRPQEQESTPRFSSQVQLVEVYATVADAKGELVTGLRREDFEVFENNQSQDVSTFAAGEFPLTVALGVDRSWSMAGDRLRLARQASQAFLRELKPADRSMVVAISSEADVVAPLTMDRFNQERTIAALDPWGTTSLHDAIIAALDRLEPEAGRQALVVFSDGEDRYSRAAAAEVRERARRSNALVYPIAIGRVRPPLLAELAVLTGGRSFLLREIRDLEKTLAEIARELRYQYLLGYAPSDAIDPGIHEWRSIRVVVKKPRVRVRARDGYLE